MKKTLTILLLLCSLGVIAQQKATLIKLNTNYTNTLNYNIGGYDTVKCWFKEVDFKEYSHLSAVHDTTLVMAIDSTVVEYWHKGYICKYHGSYFSYNGEYPETYYLYEDKKRATNPVMYSINRK